jgi:hypothetical protein
MGPLLVLAVTLALASPAFGQSPLEQRRAQVASAQAELSRLDAEEAARRTELDALSRQIESLKQARRRTAGSALEADLRRSQVLSDTLAELARKVADAKDAAHRADQALLSAIQSRLDADLKAWTGAGHDARAKLLTEVRALQAERDAVRARLPQDALPELKTPTTDDPTALLEQADALRDSEDKVRRQLATLQGRIAEARRERELDLRMNELSGDEGMFDEQDRSLRLTRGSTGEVAVDAPGDTRAAGDGYTATPAGASGGPTGPQDTPPPPPPPVHAVDHAPQLGSEGLEALPVGDDLGSLEKERARLEALAHSLEAQARAAEAKAHADP